METLLAVDFGTTHMKAAAFDIHGRQIALALQDTPTVVDHSGVVCIDPHQAAANLFRVLSQVMGQMPRTARLLGLGMTSMAEAFVALDKNNAPLRPIMMWTDFRLGADADAWARSLGGWEWYRRTGLVWHPKYTIGKLSWMRENEPDLFQSTRAFVGIDGYIGLLLTGAHRTDHTIAQRTGCYNIQAGNWDDETLAAIGVERAAFDMIQPSGSLVGGISQQAAALTGLPVGLPVYLGGHDHQCAAHGIGVVTHGEMFASMGTAEVALCLSRELLVEKAFFQAGVSVHPFISGDCYCQMGSIQSSGGSVEWFGRTFFPDAGEEIYRQTLELNENISPGPGTILYLPHLKGSVTPHMDPHARACFIGIGADTRRSDLLQAIYEGVSYEQRVIVDIIEKQLGVTFSRMVVSGGATLNPLWMKIKASVLDKTLALSSNSQTALLGAAMRAGIGANVYADSHDAVQQAGGRTETLEPDARFVQAYTEIFEKSYRHLYHAVSALRPETCRIRENNP